jgi:hypothetical protein
MEDLEQAADAAGLTVDQVVRNIQASRRQGQRQADAGQAAQAAPGGQPSEAVGSDETRPLGESTAGMPEG